MNEASIQEITETDQFTDAEVDFSVEELDSVMALVHRS